MIFTGFNIGRSALRANQLALQVTAQNIANANTDGYSRQEVILSISEPQITGYGPLGTGVKVDGVRSLRNRFLEGQIQEQRAVLGESKARNDLLIQVEALFTEEEGGGFSVTLREFFSASHDLAANPQGMPERSQLRIRAQALAQAFNGLSADLNQLRQGQDPAIAATVKEINQFASQIAELNERIRFLEIKGGAEANELRDQRTLLLGNLSELVQVNTFEDGEGRVGVILSGGRPLVEGTTAWQLKTFRDGSNTNLLRVGFPESTGQVADITSTLSGGKLGGLLQVRDVTLQGLLKKVDRLAAGVINEVNRLHTAGFGLDGSTGNRLFAPLKPAVEANKNNGGSGTISGAIFDATALTLDEYEVAFDGTNYNVTNTTQGKTVGSFSGPSFSFEGITLAVAGTMATGDRFAVSVTQGSAREMKVDAAVSADLKKIAAAQDPTALPGDNRNALAIAALEETLIMEGSTATFGDYYASLVGEVGSDGQAVSSDLKHQEAVLHQLNQQRESISGVSIDEEAINLVRFQRAFEASARYISVVDDLMKAVMDIL